ncbi:ATP-binding protein [Bradyrhizobium sp. 87]|uniref:ATP-binding protein n=1 Tax=Bradyrhizobium sp. 87 TaxID=2782682 RepID=UPI0023EEC8F1|nr:ATP-binding protein [Bradyrhizobium sp. 87]
MPNRNSSACDTGKSDLTTALAVEAVKAGKSVAFATIADIVTTTVREHLRFLARASLLVVDEIGYLPVAPGGGNLFFQLEDARYDKGAMILYSNWPQQCLIDCFPTQLLSHRAIGSASTPLSFRKTSARQPAAARAPRPPAWKDQ